MTDRRDNQPPPEGWALQLGQRSINRHLARRVEELEERFRRMKGADEALSPRDEPEPTIPPNIELGTE